MSAGVFWADADTNPPQWSAATIFSGFAAIWTPPVASRPCQIWSVTLLTDLNNPPVTVPTDLGDGPSVVLYIPTPARPQFSQAYLAPTAVQTYLDTADLTSSPVVALRPRRPYYLPAGQSIVAVMSAATSAQQFVMTNVQMEWIQPTS